MSSALLSNLLPPRELAPDERLWTRLDALIDRAPRDSDLRFHGVEQLALRRRRLQGATLGPSALATERTAAATSLLAPLVLQRVLDAVDGPVVLMKGPEVAQWWQNPLLRPYRDVDVLVEDANAAWQAMRAAGFTPTGKPELYVGIHHLRPLVWPGLPLTVEVHHEPKWIDHVPPPTAELLETAVTSATGLPGLLALEPARHAVVLAVHAWAHVPLSRLDRLVDVAAVSQGSAREELIRIAKSWEVERIWRSTQATIDSLFGDRRRPPAARLWARHLWQVRERTIMERQLERWLAPFSALPPARALEAIRASLADQFARPEGETRRQMVRRVSRSAANASKRVSDHEERTSR